MKNPLERFKHRNIAKVATAYAVVRRERQKHSTNGCPGRSLRP